MNKRNLILGMASVVLFANNMLAGDCKSDKDELDINCIIYIEDEPEIDLGFDTADYLPDGFDPHKFYFDINGLPYIELDPMEEFNTEKYLPTGFNAYAYPKDIQSMNYIDPNDVIALKIDTKKYLPKGFDAYARK